MPHNTMLISVLQASTLWILACIIDHYSLKQAFTPVEDYTEAYKANRTEAATHHHNSALEAVPANVTLPGTVSDPNAPAFPKLPKGFLTYELPKSVVLILCIAVLRYYWLNYLERLLPARPRAIAGPARPSEKEDDDSREEEVIRKWIEAGKVKRASLSWFNTFAKWILDLTVGNFLCNVVQMTVMPAMEMKLPWKEFDKWEFLFHTVMGFIGLAPIATLIAFILIPAHKRIVFEGGADLAWKLFFGAFLHVLVPWMMQKELVLAVLRNGTEAEMGVNSTFSLGQRMNGTGGGEL